MNFSEKLGTIQELARAIVDTCSEYKDAESHACMTSANEIFELAEQLRTAKGIEEHYGLGMDGRKPDNDGVSGSGQVFGTVRYKTSPERLSQRRVLQSLQIASSARSRTAKARAKSRRKAKR